MAIAAMVIYIMSAIRIWRHAPGVLTNRLAALLCADLAVWVFQAAVSYAADDPVITIKLSRWLSWSWPMFAALALHLGLEIRFMRDRMTRFKQGRTALLVIVYASALFLYYLLAGPLLRGAVRRAGYWSVDIMPGPGYTAFSAFYFLLNIAGMVLVGRSLYLAKTRREKMRLGLIFATHIIALAGGFTTDTVLEALGIDFPKVGSLWACVWALGLNLAMERYGFLQPFSPQETGLLMDGFIARSMDGIVVCDSLGRVIYWNSTMEELTGIPASDAIHELLSRLQALALPDQASLTAMNEAIAQSLSGHGKTERRLAEFAILSRDGRRKWVQASPFLIPSGGGDILAFIMRDVTQEKLANEAALERLRRQSHAQKMEALGSLAGGLAHDFNNTLGGIVGAMSLIEASMDGEDLCKPLDITREISVIRKSLQRAASSVRGLMAFTTSTPPRNEALRLDESLKRVAEFAGRTMGRSIKVVMDDMPTDAIIVGDAPQLEQLVLNLVINAEQSMTIMRPTGDARGGTITLSLRNFYVDTDHAGGTVPAHPEAAPGPYWAIEVSDQGVGMDERTLARAFDPFYTTKSPEQGSGLGLSMVHLIARQHGGFVDAVSKPGVGSTFTVHLPAAGQSGGTGGARIPAATNRAGAAGDQAAATAHSGT